MTTPTDITPVELPAVPAAETEDAPEAAPSRGWSDYDLSTFDGEDYEGFFEPGHVEAARAMSDFYGGSAKTAQETADARLAEMQSQADYYKSAWTESLRADDPERYKTLEERAAAAEAETARQMEIVKSLSTEQEAQKTAYAERAAAEGDRYMSWLEAQYDTQLKADQESGGHVIASAIELNAELGVEPHVALDIGFEFGLEGLAELAEVIEKGYSPENAVELVKRLHASKPLPAAKPVVAPVKAPTPKVVHSPAAKDSPDAPPAPVRRTPSEGSHGGDGQWSASIDIAQELFNTFRP